MARVGPVSQALDEQLLHLQDPTSIVEPQGERAPAPNRLRLRFSYLYYFFLAPAKLFCVLQLYNVSTTTCSGQCEEPGEEITKVEKRGIKARKEKHVKKPSEYGFCGRMRSSRQLRKAKHRHCIEDPSTPVSCSYSKR